MSTVTLGFNGKVATKPFPQTGVEVKATSGFATIQNRSTLTGLEVVFGNADGTIRVGDIVWVRSDGAKSWGVTQTLDKQELAIVPPEYVVLVTRTRKDPEPYVPQKIPQTPAPFPGERRTP